MDFSDNDNSGTIVANPGANQPTPQPTSAPSTASATSPAAQQPNAQQMVSNPAPAQPQQQTVNSSVPAQPQQKYPHASRVRDVAEILAGGPRIQTTINSDGSRTVQRSPLSGRAIGMAIALEALSGGMAGLAAGRGRGPGAAGVAGMQQGATLQQQRMNRDQEQAQQDFNNRSKALAAKAQISEINSRTLLNTAEAEKYGADAIDKQIAINRASGVLDIDSDKLENGGQPMTQQEILDAMQKGKINSTAQIGPVAGRVEVTRPDGTKYWEATHVIIKDPNAPTTLTQEDWDRYSKGGVPGFPPGVRIGTTGAQVPLRTKQLANEVLAAHGLSDQRLNDIRETLKGTQWADKVPQSVDFSQPGVRTAMQRFQKYVSHSNMHGMDVFESLQAMGADKRNPQTGEMEPNPDAKFVDSVAQSLGGWPLLKAVHDKLESDTAGAKSRAEARARGDEELKTARLMIPIKGETAGAEEQARVAANPQNNDAVLTTPDALGFTPKVPGGLKEYNKRQATFKKNADDLSKTEGTYQQFQDITRDINAGKFTGAASIVGLFDAIGISATPLAGRGFRVNNNVIEEHAQARGWMGALQQKLLAAKAGDIITPQQLQDYAAIAAQARQSQYVNLANQVHNAGLNADFVLPTGNGQAVDQATARIFLQLTGNNFAKAAAAMKAKGWIIP